MDRVHVALFLCVPIFTLLAPTVKEKTLSLFSSSSFTPAYEGDGILIGDTGINVPLPRFPFKFINWRITQQPEFGDAYHTISFFVVPERLAPKYLYPINSSYKSQTFFVDGGEEFVSQGFQHLNLRSYIYLLPKTYTGPGKEARAVYVVDVKRNSSSSGTSKPLGSSVCRFGSRAEFSDFLDMDRIDKNAVPCLSLLGSVTDSCSEGDRDCINAFRSYEAISYPSGSPTTFTTTDSSYNFFSAVVPTKSYVHYESDVVMYFYNHRRLGKFYKCRIRATDTCSFTTSQSIWNPREREVIIAYTHPTSVASSLTTTISVEAEVYVTKTAAHLLVCLLIPCLLIKTMLLYFYSYLYGHQVVYSKSA